MLPSYKKIRLWVIHSISKIIFPFVKIYWKVYKPSTRGVKIIIEHNGQFLLIRNSYGYRRWTFPGGGINKKEELLDAARREVQEEVGLQLKTLQPLGVITSTSEGKRDTIHIIYATTTIKDITIDAIEIAHAEWFSLDTLPPLGPIAQKIWNTYKRRILEK